MVMSWLTTTATANLESADQVAAHFSNEELLMVTPLHEILADNCRPLSVVVLGKVRIVYGLTAAQEMVQSLMTALTAVSLGVQFLSGGAGGGMDLQSMTLTGLMRCTRSASLKGGFGTMRVLAPVLIDDSVVGLVLTQVTFVAAVILIQVVGAAGIAVVARRQAGPGSGALSTDEESKSLEEPHPTAEYQLWRNSKYVRSFATLRFPALSEVTIQFIFQGTLFCGVRLLQDYVTAPKDDVYLTTDSHRTTNLVTAVFVLLFFFPLPLVFVSIAFYVPRRFDRFSAKIAEDVNRYSLKMRCFLLLPTTEPEGRIHCESVRLMHGPIVNVRHPNPLWALLPMASGWVMCAGAMLQFNTRVEMCIFSYVFIALMHFALAALVVLCRPKIGALTNACCVVQFVFTGTAVVLVIVSTAGVFRISDTWLLALGLTQLVVAVMNLVAMLGAMWSARARDDFRFETEWTFRYDAVNSVNQLFIFPQANVAGGKQEYPRITTGEKLPVATRLVGTRWFALLMWAFGGDAIVNGIVRLSDQLIPLQKEYDVLERAEWRSRRDMQRAFRRLAQERRRNESSNGTALVALLDGLQRARSDGCDESFLLQQRLPPTTVGLNQQLEGHLSEPPDGKTFAVVDVDLPRPMLPKRNVSSDSLAADEIDKFLFLTEDGRDEESWSNTAPLLRNSALSAKKQRSNAPVEQLIDLGDYEGFTTQLQMTELTAAGEAAAPDDDDNSSQLIKNTPFKGLLDVFGKVKSALRPDAAVDVIRSLVPSSLWHPSSDGDDSTYTSSAVEQDDRNPNQLRSLMESLGRGIQGMFTTQGSAQPSHQSVVGGTPSDKRRRGKSRRRRDTDASPQ